jgi:hypothetical protein
MKFPGHEKFEKGHLFHIEEFVPFEIFKQYGKNSIWFLDQQMVESMFWLRRYFDAPIVINNKHIGGRFNYRGFRPRSIKPVGGGELSQHYRGCAVDFNVIGLTSDQVAKKILDDEKLIITGTSFTTIENPDLTQGWTHLDTRRTDRVTLLIVG